MDRGVKSFKRCYHKVGHHDFGAVYRFYLLQKDFKRFIYPASIAS